MGRASQLEEELTYLVTLHAGVQLQFQQRIFGQSFSRPVPDSVLNARKINFYPGIFHLIRSRIWRGPKPSEFSQSLPLGNMKSGPNEGRAWESGLDAGPTFSCRRACP